MLFQAKRRIAVRTIGDPVLAQVARPVPGVTEEVVRLAGEMLVALRSFNGIGIAAPQYGVSLRLVVLDVPADSVSELPTPGEEKLLPLMPLALVNPEIVSSSTQCATRDEGCLSVPRLYAPVTRPEKVVLRAASLDGELFELECGGLLARCVQHELDHLEGKLFTDRLAPEEFARVEPEIKLLRKNGAKRDFRRTKAV